MKIPNVLKQMTIEDKIALCSGKNFWETKDFDTYAIPSIFMCDGPHGLRKQEMSSDMLGVNESVLATCFPTAVTSGASWDPDLLMEIGEAIGEEAAEKNVALVLGPGANLKRNPLCGRNFEYFSEDPYLTGKLAAGMILGIQRNGTSASLKHFACNNKEEGRFQSDGVIDDRTLREMYLTGFEIAVKESMPETVMCSYPKINGTHSSDNKELLTEILREQWGFSGLVVTDWGAMCDRIEGFHAGCDLSMPGGSAYMEKEVLEAVRSGDLAEEEVDRCAARILHLIDRYSHQKKAEVDYEAHHDLARKAAESGAVLLKNENSILPLKEEQKIVLIGDMAKHPRYQGAGSSHINPTKLVCAADALPNAIFVQGCDENGKTREALLKEAEEAAKKAEAAVVFAGLPGSYESEGFDRDNLRMPEGHVQLIERVAKANSNTIVVLCCGSVVECPWADKVKAILYMGLGGQASGEAAGNLLFGRANPSGKLTESWPIRYEDCPSSECFDEKDSLYQEGVYVGYRYYDKAGVEVRWPFGFGLSYSGFEYSDLKVDKKEVQAVITNIGEQAGAEIVQLYVEAPQNGIYRPKKELKGFQKVYLQPGESKKVCFSLDERSFAIWQDGWVVPEGNYRIFLGASSRDLRLSEAIPVEGISVKIPKWQKGSWYETPSGKPRREEWEAMLGHPYKESSLKKGSFTMDHSVAQMKKNSLIMKLMYHVLKASVSKGVEGKKDDSNPEFRMMLACTVDAPLRSLQINSGIKGNLFRGLLAVANGHFLQGLKLLIFK